MSINSISAQDVASAYIQNAELNRTSATSQASAQPAHHGHHAHHADSVSLSDDAKALASARDAVQNTPDVRADKVADIKQRISDGTYTVSARVLAQNIVDSTKQQP